MSPVPWNGSIFIYTKVIRPFILKHEDRIDDTITRATEKAKNVVSGGLIGDS